MKPRAIMAPGCALIAVAVTGCTESTDGSPQSTPTSMGASTTTSATTSTSRVLPPRPRDVDLTGVDPCKTLTTGQAKELDYDDGYQIQPLPGTDGITGAADCTYSSTTRNTGVLIIPITTEGAEKWLTDPARKTNVTPTKTTVAGFPALQLKQPDTKACEVMVDVHDGQQLDVLGSNLGGGPAGIEPYCDEAKKVAEMVIETVESGR